MSNLATSEMPIQTQQPKKSTKVWYHLLRPHTLTASFVPVLLGTVLSAREIQERGISFDLFFSFLLLCMCLQTATNIYNEYFDYVRGLDAKGKVGNGGTIVNYGIPPTTVRNLAHAFMGISFILGLYICFSTSWILLGIGLLSMAVAFLYTGGPKPIAYTPFGELFAGFFMGTLIINIAFFIQTGTITWQSVIFSIPSMILIGLILTGNSIRDIEEDTKGGRKTLVILLGKEKSVLFLKWMFALAFIITACFALTEEHPWIYLLVLLAVPKAIKASNGFLGKDQPIEMMPGMIAISKTYVIYGLMFSISLLISYFMS